MITPKAESEYGSHTRGLSPILVTGKLVLYYTRSDVPAYIYRSLTLKSTLHVLLYAGLNCLTFTLKCIACFLMENERKMDLISHLVHYSNDEAVLQTLTLDRN